MMKIALTGNVASGKSTLAEIWVREGVPLVRADDLAREVVAVGTEGLAAVVEAFGPWVLDEDEGLQRSALGKIVFADPRSRRRLEGILHPLILARRESWMRDREGEGAALAVAEIPLLFEVGLEGDFDLVVLVDAPREVRLKRLIEDRGMTEEEAKGVMDAQMDPAAKRERSHYVVHNGGSREDLEIRALALLDLLRARAAGEGRS